MSPVTTLHLKLRPRTASRLRRLAAEQGMHVEQLATELIVEALQAFTKTPAAPPLQPLCQRLRR